MITILIKIAASLVLGVLAGFGAVYIFNKMPAAWLTDYDAKPPAELTDPHIQRVKGFPWRWIYAAGFSCLLIRLSFFDVQFAAAGLFACWALLIIGLADLKYMIIPDQFVIMLAISAFGFIPYQSGLMQPLLGALVGGGVMLMVGVLGGAAFKKEVLGFGDVKLFACLGLALGFDGNRSSAHRSIASQRDRCGHCPGLRACEERRCETSRTIYLRHGDFLHFYRVAVFGNRANLLLFKPFQI